ncbi:MAG: hypothetical protein WC476_00200 [Phycisphaerae bacterium]|jgi:hypothetical protein
MGRPGLAGDLAAKLTALLEDRLGQSIIRRVQIGWEVINLPETDRVFAKCPP